MKFLGLKFAAVAMVTVTMASCDMLESSPYDVRISGEKHLTAKNVALIEQNTAGRKTIRFAMISDSQRCYDETRDAVDAINRRGDIDFVLHGGDLTEYGATKEFLWQRDILNRLTVPYVCIIGNHDCLATGVEAFRTIFGDLNFSFVAGNVKFLCLNTNALEFDHSTAVPDMSFLRRELMTPDGRVEKTVVLMHAGPFTEQFNNDIAGEFHGRLKQFPNLQFCLMGHGHNVKVEEPFGDGIVYYECANPKKRTMLLFTLNPGNSYDYEVLDF